MACIGIRRAYGLRLSKAFAPKTLHNTCCGILRMLCESDPFACCAISYQAGDGCYPVEAIGNVRAGVRVQAESFEQLSELELLPFVTAWQEGHHLGSGRVRSS